MSRDLASEEALAAEYEQALRDGVRAWLKGRAALNFDDPVLRRRFEAMIKEELGKQPNEP